MRDIPLSTADVTTSEWIIAATKAAQDAKAYNIAQVLITMKSDKVPIKEMDEWCNQAREDFPCLFIANVIGSLG